MYTYIALTTPSHANPCGAPCLCRAVLKDSAQRFNESALKGALEFGYLQKVTSENLRPDEGAPAIWTFRGRRRRKRQQPGLSSADRRCEAQESIKKRRKHSHGFVLFGGSYGPKAGPKGQENLAQGLPWELVLSRRAL
jgi:hypothetical protein